MTPPEYPHDLPADVQVQVGFARLEAKLDVALAQHGAKLDEHGRRIADTEERLRAVEARPVVSPRSVWAAVATLGGLAGVAFTFADHLYR